MVHDFTLLASNDAVSINIPKVPIHESPSGIFVSPFVFLSLFWQGQPGSTTTSWMKMTTIGVMAMMMMVMTMMTEMAAGEPDSNPLSR